MTSTDPRESRTPGYRGALPPRDDTMARPWLIAVFVVFVLVFVLSFLGIPSRFIPEATPVPLPSIPVPSASAEESPSDEASPSASASGSPSPSATP